MEFEDDLGPLGVVAGLALFSLYGLPLGLAIAWIAHRLRVMVYFGRLRAASLVKWAVALIFTIGPAGVAVALVMMPVSLHLFSFLKLMLIPAMGLASLAIGLLILIDYRKRKATLNCRPD